MIDKQPSLSSNRRIIMTVWTAIESLQDAIASYEGGLGTEEYVRKCLADVAKEVEHTLTTVGRTYNPKN